MSTAPNGFTSVQNGLLVDAALDVHCRLLAACLLMHGMQKDECHPSQATLGEYLRCDERTVQRHLKHLKAHAGLRVQREAFKGKWRNVYHVGALKRYQPNTNTTPVSGPQAPEDLANTTPVSGPNATPVSPSQHDTSVVRRIRRDNNTKVKKTQRSRSASSNHDSSPRMNLTPAASASLGILPEGAGSQQAWEHLGEVSFMYPDDDVMSRWLATYGEERFIGAVELLSVRLRDPRAKRIDAPFGWLEEAMKCDFKPNARDKQVAAALAST